MKKKSAPIMAVYPARTRASEEQRKRISKKRILKRCIPALSVALAAMLGAGFRQRPSQSGMTEPPSRKLIIDTDTGADDASALILAAKREDVELLGVTVLAGNVDLE